MKKFISYFIVFLIGFFACAWVINHFYGSPKDFAGVQSADVPRGGIALTEQGVNRVRDAAEVVGEYVVNIDTEGRPFTAFGAGQRPFFFGEPLPVPREIIPRGQASGVIFSPDGYVLTNNHVVQGAEKLYVTLHGDLDKHYEAEVVGRDSKTDLAVIKIDAKTPKYAIFGNSNSLKVGDWVIAVGNALGLGPTVTIGVVSAKRYSFSIDGKQFGQVIQTDAAINRGNSGGALADINGNLVGINTAIASTGPDGGNIGIGFAIPSNEAKKISRQLVASGKVVRPWLGITYALYNNVTRPHLESKGGRNLPRQGGAWVRNVYVGSPAAEAGVQPDDIILKINGKPISGQREPEKGKVTIAHEIAKSKIGDRVMLEVWQFRTSRTANVAVRVGEMPPDFGEQP
ncbi:MAG: hypothetical protein A2Z18_04180 [Armatimonadetes bacterium RBG_16_58_9]|nr:MAG: hypothetical protein A2Z18_04180 [Armatimonadetes bacterium RBG_16_58_9]